MATSASEGKLSVTLTELCDSLRKLSQGHSPQASSELKTSAGAYCPKFRSVLDEIAKFLIENVKIVSAATSTAYSNSVNSFAICEVEMYAYAKGVYEDRFTHRDPQQELLGTFYFHKKGGTYKGGSFKGLDVTFGSPNVSCGALIRSIREMKTGGSLVEGPSLVVDALLQFTSSADITTLVKKGGQSDVKSGNKDQKENSFLCVTEALAKKCAQHWTSVLQLQLVEGRAKGEKTLFTAPRVGLVPRCVEDLHFAGRLLRFIDGSCKLAKQRAGIIAAMLSDGKTRAEARSLSGGTQKNIDAIADRLAEVMKTPAVAEKDSAEGGVLNGDTNQPSVVAGIVAWAAARSAL